VTAHPTYLGYCEPAVKANGGAEPHAAGLRPGTHGDLSPSVQVGRDL